MSADEALYILNQMVWTAFTLAGPVLIGTLLVGVMISIVQVATQVQEITLSYVPKLMAAAVILLLLGGWMINQLVLFARSLYLSIPNLGG